MSVSVLAMDTRYKKLIQIINQLHDAMARGEAGQVTTPILVSLADYTRTHFSSEEAYLTKANYADLSRQKLEHRKFVTRLSELQGKAKQGQLGLSLEMMTFLKEWLQKHILIEDKKYAPKS